MKRLTLVLALVALVAGASYVIAQQVRDGSTSPTNGLSYWPMGGTDGTSNRVVKLDPNGILRVTEEYPAEYQTTSQTLCTPFPAYRNIIRIYTTGWFCAPFSQRSLKITTASTGAGSYALKLYLFGSEDDVNYHPIMNNYSLLSGDADADTALVDTVMFMKKTTDSNGTWIYPLPNDLYPGRYLAVYGLKIDAGSAADTNVVTVAITGQGRMD